MYLFHALQATGVVILVMLAYFFKGGEDGTQYMTVQWWGILGLIGWTYFFTATIYLFARNSSLLLMAFWGLFTLLNVAEHAGWFRLNYLPGGGALQGFAFAGVAASLLLDKADTFDKRKLLPLYYLAIGLILIAGGLLLRHHFIISKIQSTPTWVFLCNGIAFGLLALVYYLVDLSGKLHWFKMIKPAGTNTLTAYLIPYVWYSLAAYSFTLPLFMRTGALGLIKSFVFALIIVGITAVLDRFKIKLKI
jgi:predicted acyltransferase